MRSWYFSQVDGRIMSPQQTVQLTPKAAAVLACLMRHEGEVVPVETFLKGVWAGIHVTPDLVREYIADLRAALEDDARNPRFIQTVRREGFRLLGGISPATSDTLEDHGTQAPSRLATIAILKPLFGGDTAMEALGEDVALDILNFLAQFEDIGVVARHSSFSADDVTDLRAFARDVDADYILESSFARFGNVVRARFQLVDADTGRNLWAQRYDCEGDNLLEASDTIARSVVVALTGWHGELHRAEFKTISRKRDGTLNAFEHFILGCDLEIQFDAENLSRTLHHLEQSLALDPTFARAWLVYALELQWAYDVMPGQDESFLARSAEAFETAFKLAPGDPTTLAIVALKMARDGNLGSGLDLLAKAEATMGTNTDAMVCVATSKAMLTDEIAAARTLFDAALRENPTPPSWFYFVEARIAFLNREYERCILCARSGPQQISALIFRCLSHAMLGEREMARIALEDLRATYPNVDFKQFADHFPIANPARRAEYDIAVARLMEFQAETLENWPRLSAAPVPG